MARLIQPSGLGYFWVCAMLAMSLAMAGCGRKSPPVPPGTLKPRPPQGLSYAITKDGVVISWDVPTKNVDGSPIFGLKGFEVFRAKVPIDSECRECPKRFESPIWIPFKGKLKNGLRISFEDHTVTTGFRYYYTIRTSKGIFSKSEFSRQLELLWHAPPMGPLALRSVREGRKRVKLTWKPPRRFEDGANITAMELDHISYNVYRRPKGDSAWVKVGKGLKETHLIDTPSPFDQDYEYKVESVYEYHQARIHGGASIVEAALLQPKAVTRSPQHLVALPQKHGIELRWDAVLKGSEGFLIYRAGPSGLVDTVNRQPIRETVFVDTTKLPPGTYTYWVTIVKTRPIRVEGPPSKSVKIEVE